MASKPDSSPKQQAVLETAPRGSPCYQEISELIAGRDGPPWLHGFLFDWAISLALDREVQALQPRRREMRKILRRVGEAAALIRRGLSHSSVRNFLEDEPLGPLPYLGGLDHSLNDLAVRAAQAWGSPHLADSKGKTKAGQGRAATSRSISPQSYCALLIAELWRHFHPHYPTVRNQKAAQAADIFWRATGKKRKGWGNDPLPAWRHHFKAVRALKTTENLRAEIRRHLNEHARDWERRRYPDDQLGGN